MLDAIINDPRFRRVFPPVAAVVFAALFVSLGAWQLDRAAEKNRLRALFASDATEASLAEAATLEDYENFTATGRYAADRQVVLDNVIVDDHIGSYILTPFQPAAGTRWLIVNRGWLPRQASNEALPDLGLAGNERTLRGRIGHLPKVGMRKGAAFAAGDSWPKTARYPSLDELAAELGLELLPFVMLLDPDDDDGFVRHWEPRQSGSMLHYGYAAQWFAMAAAVLGVLVWHLQRK
jgi:surfeit locus 1 family protein